MYQGHLPDGSSVQRHSAGATYPYVVVAFNDRAAVQAPDGDIVWEYFFTDYDTGDQTSARVRAYRNAIDRACRLAASGKVAA